MTDEKGPTFDEATDKLADLLEYGHLLASTNPTGFLLAAESKIRALLAERDRLRWIIARNAQQRMDDSTMHVTAEDIKASLEILYEMSPDPVRTTP